MNEFFTMRNREVGTKHVFAGGTRLVSKLVVQPKDVDGDGEPDPLPGCDREPWGWTQGNGGQGQGQGVCSNNGNGPGAGPEVFEKDQYYYHPDHLGSSSYVTDLDGEIFQHLEYFPFGETWVEEHSNTQRTPYLFTAKELDEETGLYYFGARYYDPRTSVWQSPDPILAEYLPEAGYEFAVELPNLNGQYSAPHFKGKSLGGVFEPKNKNLYAYSHHNSLKFVDPDGEDVVIFDNGPTTRLTSEAPYFELNNPFGHTAIAVEGAGLYSFGNATDGSIGYRGASVSDYVADQSARRNTYAFVIETTPEQDAMILEKLQSYDTPVEMYPDNCTCRVIQSLQAGDVELSDPLLLGADPIYFPASLQRALAAKTRSGEADVIYIPQNSSARSDLFERFEPASPE